MRNYQYHLLAAIIAILMVVAVRANFPKVDKYHYGADEGYYLHYSKVLHDEGFYPGMRRLSNEHAEKLQRSVIPSPLRIFHMFNLWVFSYLFGGIAGLSWLSLISYLLMLVVSFLYIYRTFGGLSALVATVLLATAPLGLGISARALMDSTNYLMIIVTMVAFLQYLAKPSWRNAVIFIIVHWLCVMEKDVNIVFLPAFALVWLFLFWRERDRYAFVHGLVVAIAVPVLCFVSYMVFVGWDNFLTIFTALGQAYKVSPFTSYGIIYHNGPWYQFIVDYAILAPLLLVVSLFGVGYLFAKDNVIEKRQLAIMLTVFISNAIFIATVSMNVRYIIYMEWFMALIVAVVVPLWLRQVSLPMALRNGLLMVFVGFIAIFNVVQYNRIFVQHTTYDTINYNLLYSGEVLPKMYMQQVLDEERIKLTQVPLSTEAQAKLTQSYELYKQRDFETIIANCKAIIKEQPYHAETYNLLCAAYNELGLYHYASEACNMALMMQPDFNLAENNLMWATTQLQAQQ
ncbi:hypothetical protein BH09BAC1_BH09BAC1_01230 [soil metagenome]